MQIKYFWLWWFIIQDRRGSQKKNLIETTLLRSVWTHSCLQLSRGPGCTPCRGKIRFSASAALATPKNLYRWVTHCWLPPKTLGESESPWGNTPPITSFRFIYPERYQIWPQSVECVFFLLKVWVMCEMWGEWKQIFNFRSVFTRFVVVHTRWTKPLSCQHTLAVLWEILCWLFKSINSFAALLSVTDIWACWFSLGLVQSHPLFFLQ